MMNARIGVEEANRRRDEMVEAEAVALRAAAVVGLLTYSRV
jgi:hypothetical protein